MPLSRESLRFVRDLFSQYYRTAPLRLPEDLSSREFAFQTLDTEVYVRHVSFSSEAEVRAYLVFNTPRQAYYSTAKYLNPAAPDFSEAVWRGSELMFDIDADKLPGCRTLALGGNVNVVTEECLEEAKRCLERLVFALSHQLGFSEEELMVYFSGNRGFHVIVTTEDPEWLSLGSIHRLELVDYIAARGIDLRRVTGSLPRGARPEPPSLRDGGWRSLVAKFASGAEISDEVVKSIAVGVDPLVTQDVSRLIRIPNSINGKTGLPARLLKLDSIDRFKLDENLSAFEGYAIVKPKVSYRGPLLGRLVELSRDVSTKVDVDLALFLVLNDLAAVVRYELSRVRELGEYY